MATRITPFYANYGFQPRTNWPTDHQFRNPASEIHGHYLTSVHMKLSEQLKKPVEAIKKYNIQERRSIYRFRKRELARLNGNNIRAKR